MNLRIPRTSSKAFRVLQFIASTQTAGARYSDIERFICGLNGYDYDLIIEGTVTLWDKPRLADGSFQQRSVRRRRHAGIWGTNLCSTRTGLLPRFCEKHAGRWFLNNDTYRVVKETLPTSSSTAVKTKPSALDGNFKSDEIVGNSEVVSRKYTLIPNALTPELSVKAGETVIWGESGMGTSTAYVLGKNLTGCAPGLTAAFNGTVDINDVSEVTMLQKLTAVIKHRRSVAARIKELKALAPELARIADAARRAFEDNSNELEALSVKLASTQTTVLALIDGEQNESR